MHVLHLYEIICQYYKFCHLYSLEWSRHRFVCVAVQWLEHSVFFHLPQSSWLKQTSQFTCSFPDKKQIRPVKGEKDSGYLFLVNIGSKYAGEKLSGIKGRSNRNECCYRFLSQIGKKTKPTNHFEANFLNSLV